MISATVEITNKLGLHARASSKLVMLANKFACNITITKDNRTANAKSLMTVMMLAANKGSSIVITADGADEIAAMEEVSALIHSRFGEAE